MTFYIDDPPTVPSFYDSPEFIRYCGEIQAALIECGEMTIGDIHRRVGRDRIRWTMAALEHIGVETRGTLPTRFRLAPVGAAAAPCYSNDYVFSYRAPYRRGIVRRRKSDVA